MRILLVEDEQKLCDALRDTLQASGYTVDCCNNGEDALDAMCTSAYSLVLLDRMLPKMDGVTALREARQRGIRTPVLILTALDAVGDRVTGLDAGADDYLSKPFATEELLARVRALVRRSDGIDSAHRIQRGDLVLEVQPRLFVGPAVSVTLSQREYALLELLLRNTGVLPRERLLLSVWGPDTDVETGNLDNYIYLVRRRLKIVGSRMTLRTQRGTGYCLEDAGC